MKPHYILFDLGGVLFYMEGFTPPLPLFGIPPEELHPIWTDSEHVQRYETGRSGIDEFADGVVAEFSLQIKPAEFAAAFSDIRAREMDGATPLVRSLQDAGHAVGCLSNTSQTHVDSMSDASPLLGLLEHTFYSHEIGLMKPDPAAFRHVADAVGRPLEQILFLDDAIRNVEAARALGMQAEQVTSPQEARLVLLPD